ncbi:hypothetical protein V2J09_001538 [Rumex salicifolius]
MVKHWVLDFNPMKDSIKTICTWVRLSNLLVLLYDERVIRCIASSLGNPIRVDKNTLHATRDKYVRVCIELYLSKPLQGAILVNGEQIVVCIGCGKQGHLVNRCPLFAELQNRGKRKNNSLLGKSNTNSHRRRLLRAGNNAGRKR